MSVIAVVLLVIPLVVAVAAFWLPPQAGGAITAVAGVASFGLVLALIDTLSGRDVAALDFIRIDALSGVFMLATSFLYASVAVYSIGYLRSGTAAPRYSRRFWTGLNIFAWSMLAAPAMSNLALLWVAIEVTTIVSALLVALEGTDGAVEAAWKYVLLASAGLAVALLATIFLYYAGATALGSSYNLAFAPLLSAAGRLPATVVRLAFVLAVLGFGTKVGLFPVHTWLPDAHSEAPTPVSALLSGSLLAVSFYAILRFYQITAASLGSQFPRDVLLAFGIASLLLAALYLLDQHDYKRLLAYSSVEHMGILAIGVSFGVPVALAGVLLHVLAHAAAKGNAFMGAGVLVRKFGTKQISGVSGGLDVLPWSGPLLLVAVLALSALPPFGIFRSEFEIVSGGLAASRDVAAVGLVVLVTIAFLGLSFAANRMLLMPARSTRKSADGRGADGGGSGGGGADGRGADGGGADGRGADGRGADGRGAAVVRGEPSAWMVVPVVVGVVALLVLGLHPPGELLGLLNRAVAALQGPA
ncbi:MAG TPA: proton-conducting transporter membrane subunit [Streptosporangiaceae bacterium]|nr:proton-conducting transporter membrane subunit [Streptosporangiaceae bacterium]